MRRTIVGASVLSLAAAGLLASTAGAADAAGNHSAVVTHQVSASAQKAALSYWTPARLKSAKNLDVITATTRPTTTTNLAQPHGTPGKVAGAVPVRAKAAAAVHPATATPQAFTYPFPFTRFNVRPGLYRKYPYALNGKLFFTQNNSSFVCSGTSVIAPSGLRVWTAGHCTADGQGTHTFDQNAVFIPAYNGNNTNFAPFGQWSASSFTTTTAWLNSGDLSRDLGAIRVSPNSSGQTLASRVGQAGFAWNQNADQQFVDFGYPQASPFNGNNMVECIAASAVRDAGIGGSGPQPIGIGCDMTGGSSGGSWNISWADNQGSGYINGHNDYKYGSQPLAMYSPYFDTLANTVRCSGEATGSAGC